MSSSARLLNLKPALDDIYMCISPSFLSPDFVMSTVLAFHLWACCGTGSGGSYTCNWAYSRFPCTSFPMKDIAECEYSRWARLDRRIFWVARSMVVEAKWSDSVSHSHMLTHTSICQHCWFKSCMTLHHNKLWKILKGMGIPDHLTCLLGNLYADQEATVRTGHGTRDWFQIGKGVHQGCILSPCLFNFYAEYIMRNARLDEAQLESRLLGEITITSDMQITPYLWQKAKRN